MVDDYRRCTAALGITGGAVVAASFQGFDQAWLLDALDRLGPGFAGVAQLSPSVTDDEILALDAAGVRAVRFNLRRGGELDTQLALRVHELAGWHAEVYAADLAALDTREIPRLVIDHLGVSRENLPALLRLVEGGAKVKASGFGRIDLDVRETLRAIDPAALMFGTDLPGTRARRPFEPADLELVAELAPRALAENARELYERPAK
jgi:predicted TIM-barrel fold metal-dependent hydrolase